MKHFYSLDKMLLSLFLMLILVSGVVAQEINVSGTVTDAEDGIGLPGVTILLKGTTNGTVTDIDGNFAITVPQNSTLVFSYVGYETQEVIASQQKINISLSIESQMLEELIVIGYGTQKKTDKTGAVANVKAEELNGGVITDAIQSMQGKAAGVMITKKGGDPNAGFSVKIRGASGFDSNTQPLYVVDGVPGVDPTTVAPEDIETFNILKDAASAAIYGSRGSNGVIIITTKKGTLAKKGGKAISNIQFNSKVSFDRVAKKFDLLSADEMRGFANRLLQDSGEPNWTVDSIFSDGGANTDWQDEIYRTGITYSNNLNFSGGNEQSTYYASLTHANWEGVMKGTNKERTIAKVNLSHKALNDKLTLTGSLSSTFENNDYENYDGWDKDDIIYQALQRNPTDPVLNPDGSFNKKTRVFNYENPIATIEQVQNIRDAKRLFGNFKADLEIIKDLIGSVNIGYIRDDHESSYFRPSGMYATADNGYARKEYNNNTQKLIDITFNYKKTFNAAHNIDVMGGYSWQESVYSGFWAQGRDAQSDFIQSNDLQILNDIQYGDIDSWKGKWNLIGFFGRAQYNYMSKYYASASLRRDGSSKFGKDNKWGWFPTASVGWNMHSEGFMENTTWLDQLKLRGSYGISGNQEIGEYRSLVAWEPSGKAINPETGLEVVTFQPAWNSNPDLKWEETSEINIGIDFAMFNSRISGSLDVYKKNTKDLLGQYNVPVPPNLARRTFANSGELENKGIELFIQSYIVDKADFKWKTSLNASHNKSKMLDLGEYFDAEDGVRKEGYISGRGMVGEEYYVTGIIVGEEIGSFYLPTYVTIKDGKFIYESKTGGFTDKLVDAKRQIVGTASPDLELGWSNTISFLKNWTFDFAFRAMIGNDVYNATQMFFDYPGNIPSLNAVPEAIEWYEKDRETGAAIADFYVEDASFLRLDFVSLGYDFDMSKVEWVQKLRLYIASNNLFTITGYSGIDPETRIDGLAFGIDQYNVYPKTRTLTFGLNANF
ncbi:MAG: TonB-dependent receptor [Bacteroidales bacterium]|nr:TonB-dependent receptor [Bacteroidales bacterium]